jgi:hypothetical protein
MPEFAHVRRAIALTLCGICLIAQAAEKATTKQTPAFANGASAVRIRGTAQGDNDYTVGARAGQVLTVRLKAANRSVYFNINPPGSADVSMYIGQLQGMEAKLLLPADGTYVVRVYLMRSAARRSERAAYTLDISLTGRPLIPMPFAQDANVAGTPFHATAEVRCRTPGAELHAVCQAGVVRRGHDGTASLEMRDARGLIRQVLFVQGQAVASDAAEPLRATRSGDVLTIQIGSDESYEIRDALLTGG